MRMRVASSRISRAETVAKRCATANLDGYRTFTHKRWTPMQSPSQAASTQRHNIGEVMCHHQWR
eukprot:2513519-Amphidinium_carterae.1